MALPTAHAAAAEMVPTAGLDAIATCESGGNPHAQNAGSTASGLYQFLDSSWKAYGGSKYGSRAKDATPAQQTEIATSAVAVSGLTPWAASRHCWGGKVSTAKLATARHVTVKPVGKRVITIARRSASAGKPRVGRHAASAARHPVPRQRRSWGSAGHGGTYTVHPGGSFSRLANSHSVSRSRRQPNHHHLHPGEELKLPRATDLFHTGHSFGTAAR